MHLLPFDQYVAALPRKRMASCSATTPGACCSLITEAEVAALTFTDPEILSARLFTRGQLPAKTRPSLVARIDAAVEAQRGGRPVLLDTQ